MWRRTARGRSGTLIKGTDSAHSAGIVLELNSFNSSSSLLVDHCRQAAPNVPIIVVVSSASLLDISCFTRFGVTACLEVSSDENQIYAALQSALAETDRRHKVRLASASEPWRKLLVGESPSIEQAAQLIELVAARRSTVLITGESQICPFTSRLSFCEFSRSVKFKDSAAATPRRSMFGSLRPLTPTYLPAFGRAPFGKTCTIA